MKLRPAFAAAIPAILFLTGCTAFDADAATELANDTCRDEVRDVAKYPAAVEFPEGPHGSLREFEGTENPAWMDVDEPVEHVAITLSGEATFANAFGVPTIYTFGCASYFNGDGSLLHHETLVHEDSDGARYSYSATNGLEGLTTQDLVDSLLERKDR